MVWAGNWRSGSPPVRELSSGGRRKNDVIDAAAAASVAALQGDANPVLAEDAATVNRWPAIWSPRSGPPTSGSRR
jgi:hypothetical protein